MHPSQHNANCKYCTRVNTMYHMYRLGVPLNAGTRITPKSFLSQWVELNSPGLSDQTNMVGRARTARRLQEPWTEDSFHQTGPPNTSTLLFRSLFIKGQCQTGSTSTASLYKLPGKPTYPFMHNHLIKRTRIRT